MSFEHGDVITVFKYGCESSTLIVVDPNESFWQRLKVAWKLILGVSK
jgi:hypothetical protein